MVNEHGYAQLKLAYLLKTIPRALWPKIVTQLSKRGVIEDDGDVRPGKCRGYKLTANYCKGHYVICTDDEVNAAIHRSRYRDSETFQPVHRWLEAKLHEVQFDLARALEISLTLKPKKATKKHPYRPSIPEHRAQRAEYYRLLGGADPWQITIDEYGRVHSAITRIEREVRQCFSINGEPLVWIDLKNSQPLMFALFCLRYKMLSERIKKRLFETMRDNTPKAQKGNTGHILVLL
jgi:hypothetical protein